MSWLLKLFSPSPGKSSSGNFKAVDWIDVDGRWQAIRQLGASIAQADNKQAIIQADMLIDSIMKQAGVGGSTMGERLKAVGPRLPRQIGNQLWSVHKKRNELVHEFGSHIERWEVDSHLSGFEQAISEMRRIR